MKKESHVWDDEGYQNYRRRLVRESQKKRRLIAEKEGRCISCCINDADPGRKTCAACRKRIADAKRKRNGMWKMS